MELRLPFTSPTNFNMGRSSYAPEGAIEFLNIYRTTKHYAPAYFLTARVRVFMNGSDYMSHRIALSDYELYSFINSLDIILENPSHDYRAILAGQEEGFILRVSAFDIPRRIYLIEGEIMSPWDRDYEGELSYNVSENAPELTPARNIYRNHYIDSERSAKGFAVLGFGIKVEYGGIKMQEKLILTLRDNLLQILKDLDIRKPPLLGRSEDWWEREYGPDSEDNNDYDIH